MVISYEIYETSLWQVSSISYEITTSVRFCLSYDHFKLDFIIFKVDSISIENSALSRMLLWHYMYEPKGYATCGHTILWHDVIHWITDVIWYSSCKCLLWFPSVISCAGHLGVEDLKSQIMGSTSSLSSSNSSTDTKTEGSVKSARDSGLLKKAHVRWDIKDCYGHKIIHITNMFYGTKEYTFAFVYQQTGNLHKSL